MQPELCQRSCPSHNITYSIPYHPGLCDSVINSNHAIVGNHHDWPSSFDISENSSGISLDSFLSKIFSNGVVEFPSLDSAMQLNLPTETVHTTGMLETMSSVTIEDVLKWLNESDKDEDVSSQLLLEAAAQSPCFSLESSENSEVLLNFPGDNMDIDDQRSLTHLLMAYGEAMENGCRQLMDVIAKRIFEKVNPIGEVRERVAFHLFQSMENLGGYLRKESSKHIEAAFKVFYEAFPYGRFAHFTANAALLEAIPDDTDSVHIIDFDMGEGVQWPPMIEAISQKHMVLKFTSIKLEDECNAAPWKFEDTKRRLCHHARSYGVRIQVEQMSIEDLIVELKNIKRRDERREWLAFNCMSGLPQMARRRQRSHVVEFLSVAKNFLASYTNHRGILTFGDGEPRENLNTFSSYGSFFDRFFMHYQAIFESMERNFPVYLAEARTAMESLFLTPYICSFSWSQHQKELSEIFDLQEGNRLEGRKLSKENINEAMEIVKEGSNSYKVRIEGERENEMVLEWRGTPLVRVSSWM